MAATPERPEGAREDQAASALAAELEGALGGASPQTIVAAAIERFGVQGIGVVSSFGADSAVLLDMIAGVDRSVPVLFLDTGKHFAETIEYRDLLCGDLGFTDLRIVQPLEHSITAADPDGLLHLADTDACCDLRKVEPMARAVEPFSAWFTGRKRFQAATRAALKVFEAVGPRVRVNPLAGWDGQQVAAYLQECKLRENPLVAYGYLSIGCFPCTRAVQPGEDARAGRWAGQAKTECGIHLGGLAASLSGDRALAGETQ